MMGKRAFDVAVATLGLIVTAPVWVAASIAVLVDSGLPIFYKAQRVGRGGHTFEMLKFRTMRVLPGGGPAITGAGDPRVTRVGRLLRRWKVDELPQLINVLKGDMSLVGPRPEDPGYVALYDQEQRKVLEVRPGMTSPAALWYRDEESLLTDPASLERVYREEIMPAKLQMDLDYIEHRSFGGDVAILLRSLSALFGSRTRSA